VDLEARRSPASKSATTARWRQRKELRRATPSSVAAGAEEADEFRRWRDWTAKVGEVAVEAVRRWGESGVEASWKRDLRRGFGGREGGGDGGAEAKRSERGGALQDLVADAARQAVPARTHAGERV
jgi:hypothetical protein